MKHKYAARPRSRGLILFAALSWAFCILFYASLYWKKWTLWIALCTFVVLCAACKRLPCVFTRILAVLGGTGTLAAGAVFLLVSAGEGPYEAVEGSYVQSVYAAPEKVMIIVPHEDDDLNLAGGVIDSYRDADTQVKVVFFSNGDFRFKNAYRLKEALRSLGTQGVPEEDVIFMGYGDRYESPDGHLYNAPEGRTVTSHAGYRQTYGLKSHPDYRSLITGSPSDYTRCNAVRDLRELLDAERPDIIYCVDYDSNPDHRAAGFFFEEALGSLLQTGSGYHPSVYKGFAYSTAWSAKNDFYDFNVPSTVLRYQDGRMDERNCYLWEERLRLPVKSADLAYTCRKSGLWPAFASYGSQRAILHMDSIINGDKVFWQRRTDGLLYKASFFSEKNSETGLLNDFKLGDSKDINTCGHKPFDGIWTAVRGDMLEVKLEEPSMVSEIVLYDNPSMEDNILQARITLDSGKKILTGPLDPGGAGSKVELSDPVKLSGFQVEFLSMEGERAGLCELEAYSGPPQLPSYIKLTDTQENFLYNYTPADDRLIRLQVYGSNPELKGLTEDMEENFTVTADGVPLDVQDNAFVLPCPGKEVTVRAELKRDPSVYDTIVVKPYSRFRAALIPLLGPLDSIVCGFSAYTGFHLAKAKNGLLRILGVV